MQSLLYFKKGSETILDSLDPLFVGESVSPLEFSFEPAHLPRLKFASRRSGCKSRPRRIIYDFDAWQSVCRQCHVGFAGQRFFLGRKANLRGVPLSILFRGVGPRSPNSGRPPSPSISIFWIQTSIG